MEFREGMPKNSGRGGNNLVPITLIEQRGHTVIAPPLIIVMSLIIIILIVGAVSYYAAYWFLGGEK